MAFHLDEAQAQLSRTPATLRTWLTGLPEAWLMADEGPETFNPRDVLAHLIFGERTDWLGRTRIILEQGESRPFDPFDRRGFLDEAKGWTLAALLDEFERLRRANLEALAALKITEADLARRAPIPGWAPSRWSSCWPPGWSTIWATWPRSPGSWPSATRWKWDPGWTTCRS